MINQDQFINALSQAGLKKNDNVLIHSGIALFGKTDTDANKKSILDFYYNNLMDYLGTNGTIVTPTFTGDQYVRKNLPYDIAHTKSELGSFSEHIRNKGHSIRSMHPIVSLASIGKNAKYICGGNHYDGYGLDSPWGRLLELNSKILTLGYAITPSGMSAIHFLENMIGVSIPL